MSQDEKDSKTTGSQQGQQLTKVEGFERENAYTNTDKKNVSQDEKRHEGDYKKPVNDADSKSNEAGEKAGVEMPGAQHPHEHQNPQSSFTPGIAKMAPAGETIITPDKSQSHNAQGNMPGNTATADRQSDSAKQAATDNKK